MAEHIATEIGADEIRILYVIGGRRIGGMETHLLTLASQLPPGVRGFVCCLDASADYLARLSDLGIACADLACPTLMRPHGLLACRRLTRLVRRIDPHIVHAYGFSADMVAALLRLSGTPARIITSRRGEERNRRHQMVRRLVNRLTDRIVCVSPETAAFVRATESPAPPLLAVIPNGVAAPPATRSRRTGDGDRPVRFGTLGTVKPIKGTDLLVDAFMQFPPDDRVELVVAGLIDRPWAEALRDRARADTRIRFVGRTSTPRDFLADLDVFVLPSRSEGMSNALLEAMAAGLPCIATDVGSNRSVLCPATDAPAGLMTETTPHALFEAMRTLAARPDARSRYGAQGVATVRAHHTVPGMVREYERLYRSVVGSRLGSGIGSGRPTETPAGADSPQGMTVDA
jgi:glycosyltransferase involved in cell wall biosynthesis